MTIICMIIHMVCMLQKTSNVCFHFDCLNTVIVAVSVFCFLVQCCPDLPCYRRLIKLWETTNEQKACKLIERNKCIKSGERVVKSVKHFRKLSVMTI